MIGKGKERGRVSQNKEKVRHGRFEANDVARQSTKNGLAARGAIGVSHTVHSMHDLP